MKMRANLICCWNTEYYSSHNPPYYYYIIKCGFNPDYKLIRPNDDYLYRINKYKVVKRIIHFLKIMSRFTSTVDDQFKNGQFKNTFHITKIQIY